MGTREKRIGIRELKSTLSECVREVRAGRGRAQSQVPKRSDQVAGVGDQGISSVGQAEEGVLQRPARAGGKPGPACRTGFAVSFGKFFLKSLFGRADTILRPAVVAGASVSP